jgi:hypothetical protein
MTTLIDDLVPDELWALLALLSPRSATTPATRRPVGTLGRNGDYARTPEPYRKAGLIMRRCQRRAAASHGFLRLS